MEPRKKKLAIIGAGNAACITAMHYYHYGKNLFEPITIYYDPEAPIERVGQGTTLPIPDLIFKVFGINWYNQADFLKGTRKDGILYENWGSKSEKFFHPFPFSTCSIHYVPKLVSQMILNSGLFEIVEKIVDDPEKEIDADVIFDCRGRHNRDSSQYEELTNPLNSVVLGRTDSPDFNLHYTRCVATPDGWTFVIPNYDGVSYGYLYNDNFTDKEKASKNLEKMFGVISDGDLTFNNYVAKNFFVGERTILNGNRGAFLEPLEATSLGFYEVVAKFAWDHIVNGVDKTLCNDRMRGEMFGIQDFVLWHYQAGSKFDTPFWEYARNLPFNPNDDFKKMVQYAQTNSVQFDASFRYSQWPPLSFQVWLENT